MLIAAPRPRRAAQRDAADRARGGGRPADLAGGAGRARGPPAPGHRDRPGGGRQVPAAARAHRRARESSSRRRRCGAGSARPTAPGIAYWAFAEVLRGEFGMLDNDAARGRLGEAARRGRGALAPSCGEPASGRPSATPPLLGVPLGIEPPTSDAAAEAEDPQRMRETLFSAARGADRGDDAAHARWCWRSRTSTGPTRECST